MLFRYTAIDAKGNKQEGTVDAVTQEAAITALQRRGLMVAGIEAADGGLFSMNISFFERVSQAEVVVLSRQIATLFEAQVSALRVFRLLALETENPLLQRILLEVADDLQGGASIAEALAKHPAVFSEFYVNMVRAGEETGRLDQTFNYLADYLDRMYELTSKAKSALIYPAFVITVFIGVMVLMLTYVIPRIGQILEESGQELPIYTKIVLGISHFFSNFGVFIFIALAVGIAGFMWWSRTPEGRVQLDTFKLYLPYFGTLFRKLYLARFADNLATMVASGIPMVRSLEITAAVIGNEVYKGIVLNALEDVKNGKVLSEALNEHKEMPGIIVGMVRVGEETGRLEKIMKTLASFYEREVQQTVDALIDLIEPAMIVLLGLGVGVLLAAVLIPIYNVSTAG
ncbi:type II secretion system F family protein [Candidatus Parcubacteria bacterium]|nr:MAG: type II secretion system F family protein [Candidatus Parcubacteria bacterium]